jgi:hypothetical protein
MSLVFALATALPTDYIERLMLLNPDENLTTITLRDEHETHHETPRSLQASLLLQFRLAGPGGSHPPAMLSRSSRG